MYAIVKTGGKQYKVAEGSTLLVEKLEGDPEATVELTEVLMVSDDSGLKVGAPTVPGAKVIARIVEQGKGKKIDGYVYKPKKNVRRRYGHRQPQTRLHIESIVA
jgi:large subunit ribosomal protein L21